MVELAISNTLVNSGWHSWPSRYIENQVVQHTIAAPQDGETNAEYTTIAINALN